MLIEDRAMVERVPEVSRAMVSEEPTDRCRQPIGEEMGVAVDDHVTS